ncbi:hypothetical protein EDB19DRAFT_616848 [Suillus lakei]|nr:hypothetical protein EDB19DRAFT_616848 [Suillus lakei]
MSKRKAIVKKKLHSVEALGCIYVICSGKIDTSIKNKQTVTEIYVVDEIIHIDDPRSTISPAVRKVLEIESLCHNSSMSKDGEGKLGQSPNVALINVLSSFNISDQQQSFTRLSEKNPFNSEKVHGRQQHSLLLHNYLSRFSLQNVLHQEIHRRHHRSLQVLLYYGWLNTCPRR